MWNVALVGLESGRAYGAIGSAPVRLWPHSRRGGGLNNWALLVLPGLKTGRQRNGALMRRIEGGS